MPCALLVYKIHFHFAPMWPLSAPKTYLHTNLENGKEYLNS